MLSLSLLLLLAVFPDDFLFKETYVILPKSLKFCKEREYVRDLTITKQISLNFDGINSLTDLMNDTSSLKFVCSVIVKPLGRSINLIYSEGTVNFWKLRFLLKFKLSCSSTLTMHFLKEDIVYEPSGRLHESNNEDKSRVYNYSCGQQNTVSMDANNRKLLIFWSSDSVAPIDEEMLDIQLSTYMSFDGNFSQDQRERHCILQYGFWCSSHVCINAQMRCDQADGCFDGGSDEDKCPAPRNVTSNGLNRILPKDNWSGYLPWIVLGILPLVLIFSLILIANQRRHGLDSISSENDDQADRNDKDDLSFRPGERKHTNSVDYVGGNEGFSIRYGGRIHRLSGDPRDNSSLNSSDSNLEWNETTQYLPQNSPKDHSKSLSAENEIHSNFLDIEDAIEETPNSSKDSKPKMYYKIGEFPGEISPTLTTGSSLNDNSPAGMRSQMSVVTYCGSERSCGIVHSPSGEEIMMKELASRGSMDTRQTAEDEEQLDEDGFYSTKVEVIHC